MARQEKADLYTLEGQIERDDALRRLDRAGISRQNLRDIWRSGQGSPLHVKAFDYLNEKFMASVDDEHLSNRFVEAYSALQGLAPEKPTRGE